VSTPLGRVGLALGAAGIGAALLSSPAQSAVDTTPPTLNAPLKASFAVGAQIPLGAPQDCGGEPWDLRLDVPVNFKWRGSDDSGAVRYDLVQNTGYDGANDVFVDSPQTSHGGWGTNTDQACGGGNHSVYEWNLTARDAAGNTTTRNVYGGRIRLTQDNNLTDTAGYASRPTVVYDRSWQLASCACWSQGGVHKTTTAGASATITFEPSPDSRGYPAVHVGLVMHQGPDRGKFKVYVDGVLKSTVDTYAATKKPRSVVWQSALSDWSSKVKIVNAATRGRARIDLDAVLTN